MRWSRGRMTGCRCEILPEPLEHAGAGDDAASTVVQIREGVAQQVAGRVARSRVIVLPRLIKTAKRISGTQVQRRNHSAGYRATVQACANGARAFVLNFTHWLALQQLFKLRR